MHIQNFHFICLFEMKHKTQYAPRAVLDVHSSRATATYLGSKALGFCKIVTFAEHTHLRNVLDT